MRNTVLCSSLVVSFLLSLTNSDHLSLTLRLQISSGCVQARHAFLWLGGSLLVNTVFQGRGATGPYSCPPILPPPETWKRNAFRGFETCFYSGSVLCHLPCYSPQRFFREYLREDAEQRDSRFSYLKLEPERCSLHPHRYKNKFFGNFPVISWPKQPM